ncbi:MAG: hypothetical protein M3P33_01740, partial [bacterium]|nr:hypothetical protein [bacterium]
MADTDILQTQIEELRKKISSTKLPDGMLEKCNVMIERISRMAQFGSYSIEYENASRYIDTVLSLPWYSY